MEKFEEQLKSSLIQLLRQAGELDDILPETADIDEKWEPIALAYLPDGVREFKQYPSASLGWMMYVGMAVARFWDDDWQIYGKVDNLYTYMRDKSGYDHLDEYVRGEVLQLRQAEYDQTEQLVQSCAEQAHTLLMHAGFEPGTEAAFHGYTACLRQLYLLGAAVQLKRMGYRMVGVSGRQ